MSDKFVDGIVEGGGTYHSFEVTSTTRGYTWSVKVAGGSCENVKETLVEAEAFLKEKYGTK